MLLHGGELFTWNYHEVVRIIKYVCHVSIPMLIGRMLLMVRLSLDG